MNEIYYFDKKSDMTHLEKELLKLKGTVVEMVELARVQLDNSLKAFIHLDLELAEEVVHIERRVNAIELSIDRDCENIFALYNPVATDLRFVLAVLKINSDVERIADHGDGIAKYSLELAKPLDKELISKTRFLEMWEITQSMILDIKESLEKGDSTICRKVFKKDTVLNQINRNASTVISKLLNEDVQYSRECLFLFSAIRKLERVGDHVGNIAEEIIFYLEAKVIKHQSKKEILE